jgi:transposase
MNCVREVLPANHRLFGGGFGCSTARDATAQNNHAGLPPRNPSSPRQTAWTFLKEPEEAHTYLAEICRRSPEIATCAELAREFVRIIRERDVAAWPGWKACAKSSLLGSFAKHLCQDEAALIAALQQPWSNGPVEGHVHRLKLIKRSMYGRAKFDLLRLRVVNAN